jgi:hypothetical protein
VVTTAAGFLEFPVPTPTLSGLEASIVSERKKGDRDRFGKETGVVHIKWYDPIE